MLVQQRNCGLCGKFESIVNGTDGHNEVDVGYSSLCSPFVCRVGTSRRETVREPRAVEDALEFSRYFHFILQGGWSTEWQDLHHGRTSTMAGPPPWQDLHHGRISTMAGPPPWQEIDLGALSIMHSVAVETNVSSLQCSLQTITCKNDFVKHLMCLVYS